MTNEQANRSGNKNPYRARVRKARKRLQNTNPAQLREAQAALTLALADMASRFESADTIDEACKLTNAVARAASVLAQIFSAVEIESRLQAIEDEQRKRNQTRFGGITA